LLVTYFSIAKIVFTLAMLHCHSFHYSLYNYSKWMAKTRISCIFFSFEKWYTHTPGLILLIHFLMDDQILVHSWVENNAVKELAKKKKKTLVIINVPISINEDLSVAYSTKAFICFIHVSGFRLFFLTLLDFPKFCLPTSFCFTWKKLQHFLFFYPN
jgi:hypothetical protein